MAKRRKRKSSRSKKQPEYPGWAWGAFGLALGLSVAAAVWVSDRRPATAETPVARQPASLDKALDDNGETTTVAAREPEPRPESRFDFYEMLPSAELIVSDIDPEIAADIDDARGELARVLLRRLGKPHGDVGREVAVRRIARPLDRVDRLDAGRGLGQVR